MAKNRGLIELVLAELRELAGHAARAVEVNRDAAARSRQDIAAIQSITGDVHEHGLYPPDRAAVATLVSPQITVWQATKAGAAAADATYAACQTAMALVAAELHDESAE